MRTGSALLTAAALALATGCGTGDRVAARAAPGGTELTIAVRATAGAKPRLYELSCDPPRGTVADPARACAALARIGADAFRPVPRGTACTQLYGGPQTADVGGVVAGEPVTARLTRRDGCEISRWDRLGAVVPVPVASSGRDATLPTLDTQARVAAAPLGDMHNPDTLLEWLWVIVVFTLVAAAIAGFVFAAVYVSSRGVKRQRPPRDE